MLVLCIVGYVRNSLCKNPHVLWNMCSDFYYHTICSESVYGGKIPKFLAEFVCFRQGMAGDEKWPLVSHDPSGSCDTSWKMTAGMSRSASLFSPDLPWWILLASLILLLVQYLVLFQAALVARIVQMFTHRCSRVSASWQCVFFVSCPQTSGRFPNVHFVTAVTFQLVYHPRLLFHWCFVIRFH